MNKKEKKYIYEAKHPNCSEKKTNKVKVSAGAISSVFSKSAVDLTKIQYHAAAAAAGSIPHIGSGYCSIDLPF